VQGHGKHINPSERSRSAAATLFDVVQYRIINDSNRNRAQEKHGVYCRGKQPFCGFLPFTNRGSSYEGKTQYVCLEINKRGWEKDSFRIEVYPAGNSYGSQSAEEKLQIGVLQRSEKGQEKKAPWFEKKYYHLRTRKKQAAHSEGRESNSTYLCLHLGGERWGEE